MKRTLNEIILLATTAFTAAVIFPFTIIRFLAGEYIAGIVDVLIILSILAVFLHVMTTRQTKNAGIALGIFAVTGVTLAMLTKGIEQAYWIYPTIITTYYLFKPKLALLTNCYLIILTAWISYPFDDLIKFLSIVATIAVTNIGAYLFQTNRLKKHKELKEKERVEHLRISILESIVNGDQLSNTLRSIVEAVEQSYKELYCSILLLDDSGKKLVLGAAPSLPTFYNKAIDGIEIGNNVGSCGTAAYTGQRVIVEDISSHPFWDKYKDIAAKANLLSCWSEPIINMNNEVLGTFAIYKHYKSSPSADDLKMIEQLAYLANIAIEKDQATKIIWHQANYDHLTGLLNRNMMQEHLQLAIKQSTRNKKQLVVAFLDIDHFKEINDTLGHDVGDALLQETANRITRRIRAGDIVARIGGDEFVIILSDFNQLTDIDSFANNLILDLAKPHYIKHKEVHSSVSLGLTVYPDDATDCDNLLKNADQAMYGAKADGRNSYQFFTSCMREKALKRMKLIQDLRNALFHRQFYLVYQPIVNLKTGKIDKAEALIRWLHPDQGLIFPTNFISIAEETGLIIEISDWVFKQAVEQMALWNEQYVSNIQITINTSPIQYKNGDGNILNWLTWLTDNKIDSQSVCLEITESILMESTKHITTSLTQVRKDGIAISIDDFGTGYSSLSYLKEFHTDYLKIDKRFVQKMSEDSDDIAICEAIIVMAKKLSIKVIAEGIETEEQQQLLMKMGCDYGQGYLLSKPLSSEKFSTFLKNHT